MTLPSFSVVIPTYQRRETVVRAVRALAAIDYPGEVELIVIIDGSTDGTDAIVVPLLRTDRATLAAEFETLSPESQRRRFLAPVHHLS